jgi:hypothetical protein
MPMETKKKLANTSRKGRMLPNAAWLYSESEMIYPARKAPRTSDSPTLEIS